ncbi:MAG: RlmE family RNA methyltransferase [Rhodomicrobium sp.]|nr:RlmE family RNA methyltransferase [Rhodomicrobium sp.]
MTNREPNRARSLKVKLHKTRRRTQSSKHWLERQLNDPYVAAAKREGYRSRAAFKLEEIADKYGLLKPGGVVVDLGAAPGGWSQVAAKRVKAAEGRGAVVALDILPFDAIPGVVILQQDFSEPQADSLLLEALAGRRADAVLSDMAAPTTGHRQTDHLRIMGLAEEALAFAVKVLAPGGIFLAKVFQGGSEKGLLDTLKRDFATVRHVKPKASRAESPELYVLATGFRGPQSEASE